MSRNYKNARIIASLDFMSAVQCMIHFIYHMISSLDSDITNNINALTMTHDDSVHNLHDENIIAYMIAK